MKRLTIRGTGLTLGIFFDVTLALCILWGLLLPSLHARGVPILEGILPGFIWLTPGSVVSRDPVAGTVYIVMLGLFAIMPLLVARRSDG
jgi:hypothetical protein